MVNNKYSREGWMRNYAVSEIEGGFCFTVAAGRGELGLKKIIFQGNNQDRKTMYIRHCSDKEQTIKTLENSTNQACSQ